MGDTTVSIVGKEFTSVDDGAAFIDKYCHDGCHPVKHASRSSIAQYNDKIRAVERRIVDLPPDAICSIRWVCKHFGTFKPRVPETAAKTRTRSHYTRGCGFFIYLAWNKDKNVYQIKNATLEHSHEIGSHVFNKYAVNRFELLY